jgi:hypothetical protein
MARRHKPSPHGREELRRPPPRLPAHFLRNMRRKLRKLVLLLALPSCSCPDRNAPLSVCPAPVRLPPPVKPPLCRRHLRPHPDAPRLRPLDHSHNPLLKVYTTLTRKDQLQPRFLAVASFSNDFTERLANYVNVTKTLAARRMAVIRLPSFQTFVAIGTYLARRIARRSF